MNKELLIVFVCLNILNVTMSTVKSIVTIKCTKGIAALINAISYGISTVVTIYLMCDLPLYYKALIVALCNLIGVYVVKWCEEKIRKAKLWKVEVTVPRDSFVSLLKDCKEKDLMYNYIDIEKYYLFNFYCPTEKDSLIVKNILSQYNVKYFVNESKSL